MICGKKYCVQINQDLFDELEVRLEHYNFSLEKKQKLGLDYLVCFLNLITFGNLHGKGDSEGFVRLAAKYLNKLCRNRHKDHKNFLLQNGFIKIKAYSIKRNQSYGYKICWFDQKDKSKFKPFNFHSYELLKRKGEISKEINEIQDKRKERAAKKTGHLTKWLQENYIQIDTENAYKWIENNEDLSKDQKYQYAFAVNNLTVGNWWYSREGEDNRLHSNLTNLSSNLRQFLNCQGKTLISLDLKSSQPFLMTSVLEMIKIGTNRDKEFIRKSFDKRKISNQKWDEVFSIMNYKLTESQSQKEFEAFKSIVVDLDIYIWLSELLSDKFLKEITTEKGLYVIEAYNTQIGKLEKREFDSKRSLAKVLLLEFMYSGLGSKTKTYREVKNLLPKIIVDFVAEFKSSKHLKKNYREGIKKAKKRFATFLQQFEAFLILDVITKDLAEDYPDMFMATIHDSIIVTEENVDLVKKTLEIRMDYLTGLKPEIKCEPWISTKETLKC
ncbi:hypothetical protein JM83_1692 [Gillisia sp. Hel_I_86]|uniref:hypothetical protein n=1 Tax=Gillisia sp. Hel_I_86 TaxID=1249981 RepID=UPI00119C6638|nr:hypothetical protein [Gillisia sp. Hel_I_86]TVZ26705.1 hypothetical protein JM83_1692 [Gillisia sp. Hel_I_86]